MRPTVAAVTVVSILLIGAQALAASTMDQDPQAAQQTAQKPQITIYPVLAHIPIFGAVITVPDVPGNPGASGTTDKTLNGAYMFGVIVETRHWLVDVNNLWAAVSAGRAQPLTNVDTNSRFFNGAVGLRVGGGLFVVGGIKRVGINLDVSLTGPTERNTFNGNANSVLWDPIGGVEYRGRLNTSTTCDLAFKVGGFGIGTDYDLTTEGAIDWRFWRFLVLRAGYSFVRYKLTVNNADINGLQRTLVSKQTLNGPEIGVGIRF
jgi:hypothetical protein